MLILTIIIIIKEIIIIVIIIVTVNIILDNLINHLDKVLHNNNLDNKYKYKY